MTTTGKVATVGMFDGVHRGHRALLSQVTDEAKRRGAEAWVFTFGSHPLALIAPEKAPSPLMTTADKVSALKDAGVSGVEVLDFNEALRSLTAEEFLTMLRDRFGVSVLVMGFNHRFGRDRISDINHYQEIGRRLGMEIVRANELRDDDIEATICSSSIREAIAEGDVRAAADMLGRPYALHGKVVEGKQLGRKIGFPTANVRLTDPAMLTPLKGVYAVDVTLPDGQKRRGMLNIGVRPTVDNASRPEVSIEVHIIDWSGDLYGHDVTIEFLTRLRDEQRFPDLTALTHQLQKDKSLALAQLANDAR
ncbi:MAG: riboflavin biosynthesis protein RibF [Muribaculaceae bacterium]|nr:riboflavin biosynthesis protein RibF [Muribaculaceae bacterium]